MKYVLVLLLFASLANATHDPFLEIWIARHARQIPEGHAIYIQHVKTGCVIFLIKDGEILHTDNGKTADEAFKKVLKSYELEKSLKEEE